MPIKRGKNLAIRALALARRDIVTSKRILDDRQYDWAYSIAYNAMLQTGRALMFNDGFRPSGPHQHISVHRYLIAAGIDDTLTSMFDKMRKTRHLAVYESCNIISEDEAIRALDNAKKLLKFIESQIDAQNLPS